MKKIFKSKKFLFSVLAAACIGILAVCFVVNRDRDSDFQQIGRASCRERV